MEMEALESLFPTELTKLSDKEFQLHLVPYSDNSKRNHVSVSLSFVFPETYPLGDSVIVTVVKATAYLATAEMEAEITQVMEENAGSACVYQIADRVQEWLRAHNEEECSLHDQMVQRKGGVPKKTLPGGDSSDDSDDDSDWSSDDEDDSDDDDYSEEEDDGFEGLQAKELCPESQRVTPSQFEFWKAGSDALLLQRGLIKRVAESDTRPTGKQQFVQTLKARTEGVPTTFNEELFGEDFELDEDEE